MRVARSSQLRRWRVKKSQAHDKLRFALPEMRRQQLKEIEKSVLQASDRQALATRGRRRKFALTSMQGHSSISPSSLSSILPSRRELP
eukprot:Skav214619  [mRNA]  locus=scaffold961:44238:45033:- [translate_table: standard]